MSPLEIFNILSKYIDKEKSNSNWTMLIPPKENREEYDKAFLESIMLKGKARKEYDELLKKFLKK